MKIIKLGSEIRARKNEAGTWEIKHPGRDGKMGRWYSTGVTGPQDELKRHVKEQRIEDLVALGMRGALTDKVLAQFQHGSSKTITLAKVRDEWIDWLARVGETPNTIHQYENYFDRWVHEHRLESTAVSRISFDHIDPFVNPEGSSLKRATRNARLYAIRSLFKFLTAMNYCGGNPAALVKVNMDRMTHQQKETKRSESFTKTEVRKLLRHIEKERADAESMVRQGIVSREIRKPMNRVRWMEFWQFAIIASYEVGLRLGDLCDMEWASFSEPNHMIVWTGKRDRRVSLPLKEFDPWLKEAIAQLPAHDVTYCFPEVREAYHRQRSTAPSYFTKVLAHAKIEGKSFHSLRHTAIRNMEKRFKGEEGLTHEEALERIGKLVGHSNVRTTIEYL